ncbi:MAG: response regulator transcription factor [Chloroflexota bacterium]
MDRQILIVEDDRRMARLIELYLREDGYRVTKAYDGEAGLAQALSTHPGLVILDLMLPKTDGFEVCRSLRAESRVPVIMLTARDAEDDKLRGFDLGADDYVTKPFSPPELLARVRAVLRRSAESEDSGPRVTTAGDIAIDFARHMVTLAGRVVSLRPTEFDLLAVLARNPGRVFTRSQLVERVLGPDFAGLERTIDVHVMNLRRKMEPDPAHPRYVRTVFGVGYKFEADPDAS